MLFSCGLALFTLLYSILKSCEWKYECELCESKMPKSPTKKSRRRYSPFTKEQEIWIVKRSALMTPTQLRRSFINQFLDPKKSHHLPPRPFAFTRLIQRFDATGGVTVRLKDPETVITLENIETVKQYFTEKPRCGIREGCSELDL